MIYDIYILYILPEGADAGVGALHPGGELRLASDSDMEEAPEGMFDDDDGACCFSDAPSEATSNAVYAAPPHIYS